MPTHLPLGQRFDYAYHAGLARQVACHALARHTFKRADNAWLARFTLKVYRRALQYLLAS